ncbi:MAG: hypothetical protein II776_04945 [Clostridia bacterium]|nr:hypothetical protein [Clostridia bacterium]
MKKIFARLQRYPAVATALSAIAAAAGAALSVPTAGPVSGLPLGFFLLVFACLFKTGVFTAPPVAAAVAAAFCWGLGVSSPWAYTLAVAASSLAAAGLAVLLRRFFGKAKKDRYLLLPAVLFLAVGAALPFLVCGAPWSQVSAGREARDYLETRYPDQTFARVFTYRDPVALAWRSDADFVYEGNTLTSTLLFGEKTEDGHLADRMALCMETRRSAFIEALREGEENVLVEPDGFSDELRQREVIPGVYGAYDPVLEPEMDFTVTFRREKTQKRDLALAVRDEMDLLASKGLTYHRITFVALSAGERVFTCAVTPRTEAGEILDLIQRVS